jgi:hypothetical protein
MKPEDIRARVYEAREGALRVYLANRESGADAVSVAFDAGRVDAFDTVLKILGGT